MGAAHTARYREFLRRLRQAREDAGLLQQEVADLLGRHQPFVSRCESGERRVDVVDLQDFAEVYRKPLDYFLPPSKAKGRR